MCLSEDLCINLNGLKRIVLLDTLGNAAQLNADVKKLVTGLEILETRSVGFGNVKTFIQEAIERNKHKHAASKA